MSVEDPFFDVKEDVLKALTVVKSLYSRWQDLQNGTVDASKEDKESTSTSLNNSLRSVGWDLEDLEATVGIVENNPRKFMISDYEIQERRNFVDKTKSTVREMKSKITSPTHHGRFKTTASKGQNQYELEKEIAKSNHRFIDNTQQKQEMLIRNQDDQLEMIGDSVGVLKDMSRQIGNELEDQNRMLEDFHHEMDQTDTKMDQTMKKMSKVMHMSNDRRQWCAIGVLLFILLIIIIMFITV